MNSLPTLLCIDDFEPGLLTRKAFLGSLGFHVLIANSGREGLKLLRAHPVDVVVLDYRMPEMNGEEVALRIRETYPNLPILLLSGYSRELPKRLLRIVNICVTKGDAPSALISALDSLTGTTTEKRRTLMRDVDAVAYADFPQRKKKSA